MKEIVERENKILINFLSYSITVWWNNMGKKEKDSEWGERKKGEREEGERKRRKKKI